MVLYCRGGKKSAKGNPMTAYKEFSGGKLIFYITGEIDESNISLVREEFDNGLALLPNAVILDLRQMTFIDSTGIGMIISRYNKLKKIGVPLYARGLSAQTEKVFKTAGLLNIIGII
ncbi:MAG: STAS domain-containing protein [Clostridiales bacterium]|jgi:stage II sporulation protein AA (anti-sigma F factor antagonist)|nr:STAS domain-containing protein [Clostridiales bacterium]